jgi:hypothetical protein
VAAVALEPLLKHLITKSWRELNFLRQQSVGIMVQNAADRLEISPQELIGRAWESTEKTQLLADAMYQAAQTFNLQKIKALARAVANGLRDDEARPDEEKLIVHALANVEEAHIKVLLSLPDQRSGPPRIFGSGDRQRTIQPRGATLEALAEGAGLSRGSAEHVLAELVRTGMARVDNNAAVSRQERLIVELQEEFNKVQRILEDVSQQQYNRLRPVREPGEIPDPGYVISDFGRSCLDYLSDTASQPDQAIANSAAPPGEADLGDGADVD